jgi:hypoxanthine phosphoribosyltransferase
MIQIKDKTFVPLLSRETLQHRIQDLCRQISNDYQYKNPLFLVVLNGAFIFGADLIRGITIPCEVSFIRLSSYKNVRSTGNVRQIMGLSQSVADRHVIVVEDIVDTGLTMKFLTDYLRKEKATSVSVATLLEKPDALKVPVELHYTGFQIADRFVVGFGLDYDEEGRNLDALYVLKE